VDIIYRYKGWRRVSAETATLISSIVAAIAGIAGVLIGLFADRLLQRQGKVRCLMEPIEIWVDLYEGTDYFILLSLPIPAEQVPKSPPEYSEESGRCLLNVKLFNEKEVRTGLRDVVLAFDGTLPMEKTMLDQSTRVALEVVDLPSREWVSLSLVVELALNEVRYLTECDKAWLRGYFPDGRRFNERVPFAK
jgi:hypothetical protein